MKGTIKNTTVQGQAYEVWSDFRDRCTYAKNAEGVTKCIHGSGYLSNDLTIRKAIALCFGHSSFHK